jgi:Icc-related predicted phosphoesterase
MANTMPPTEPVNSKFKIRIALISDLHSRRFLPGEIPTDIDLLLFAGDLSNMPGSLPPVPQRVIDDIVHLQSLPGRIKVVIPGNHDHLIERATGFRQAHRSPENVGEPDLCQAKYAVERQELQGIKGAVESRKLEDGTEWVFKEHGLVEFEIKGFKLRIFCSGLSELRNTSGYAYVEHEHINRLWAGIEEGVDIVMVHQPMHDDMTALLPGEMVLDRQASIAPTPGSKSLRRAVMAAQPGMLVCGHLHNSYGHHPLRYADGSQGLSVNASSTKNGTHPVITAADHRPNITTPRMPVVVEYDPVTKVAEVVQAWDGMLRGETLEAPPWAGAVRRCENGLGGAGEEMTDAELFEASCAVHKPTEEELMAWGRRCDRDNEERTRAVEAVYGIQQSLLGT